MQLAGRRTEALAVAAALPQSNWIWSCARTAIPLSHSRVCVCVTVGPWGSPPSSRLRTPLVHVSEAPRALAMQGMCAPETFICCPSRSPRAAAWGTYSYTPAGFNHRLFANSLSQLHTLSFSNPKRPMENRKQDARALLHRSLELGRRAGQDGRTGTRPFAHVLCERPWNSKQQRAPSLSNSTIMHMHQQRFVPCTRGTDVRGGRGCTLYVGCMQP